MRKLKQWISCKLLQPMIGSWRQVNDLMDIDLLDSLNHDNQADVIEAYSICESSFLIHHDVYRDLFACP